jgi:glycosyltransferase involved in cell wall biosynthesis
MASLPDFVAAIRASRFVVLPLHVDARHAAGISVIALAHAAGRPVIATRTAATLDHVRDDVDGLLVDPGDPDALAAAIARLDEDRTLLRRLSVGALGAAARGSVERWATELVHGAPPRGPVPAPGAEGGTRYAW